MKIEFKIENGKFEIDLVQLIGELTAEDRKRALEMFAFEEIIPAIERQLKREDTDLRWYCTGGDVDGSKLRARILAFQGLEPEFKNDLETKIRSLEHEVAWYKKYYDWYFKLYHLEYDMNSKSLFHQVKECIGDVEK